MLKITPVTENNFFQALAVYRASWAQSHKEICTPAFLETRDYAGYLLKRLDGLYLVEDRIPVGVFYLSGEEFTDLYIRPDFHGRGYGKEAIRFAVSRCNELRLTVLSSNMAAIGLYEKMGFRFTGVDKALKNGLQEREMRYMEKHNG